MVAERVGPEEVLFEKHPYQVARDIVRIFGLPADDVTAGYLPADASLDRRISETPQREIDLEGERVTAWIVEYFRTGSSGSPCCALLLEGTDQTIREICVLFPGQRVGKVKVEQAREFLSKVYAALVSPDAADQSSY